MPREPDKRPEKWTNDWELCYRTGEILLQPFVEHPDVERRRLERLEHRLLLSAGLEPTRFTLDVAELAAWLARRWCPLYDDWSRTPSTYVFVDGYAALFFLLGLHAKTSVVLRGQADANWPLTTSLARWNVSRSADETKRARDAAAEFVAEVAQWPRLKDQYPRGLTPELAEALCQHYGFPTNYIDVTFAYDIALFFAEDWDLRNGPLPREGSIFAMPFHHVAKESSLVVLPPAVMRPNLQSGKFVNGKVSAFVAGLERFKYRYTHAKFPAAKGLSDVSFSTSPGLKQFLYPTSDPIEEIARRFRWWNNPA